MRFILLTFFHRFPILLENHAIRIYCLLNSERVSKIIKILILNERIKLIYSRKVKSMTPNLTLEIYSSLD